jgi:pimeloyl-ACP methyl ester carboxylesterase
MTALQARVLTHTVAGSGETMLLVPGGLTGFRSFDPLVPLLADRGFRVVAVEPIANELGAAGVVGDPSYDADVERASLLLTIREVADGTPVHLVGWSNGGRAVLACALAAPEEVATVTAVEPAAWWLAPEEEGVAALRDLTTAIAGREVTDDELLAFLEIVRVAPAGTDYRSVPQWEAWRSVRNALSWYSPSMAASAEAQLVDLDQLRVPLLLARGTWTAGWLRTVVDRIAARVAQTRVAELDGGHACLLQSAAAFVDLVATHAGSARRSELTVSDTAGEGASPATSGGVG